MRLTLTIGSLVLVDLAVLEPAADEEPAAGATVSGVELFTGPTPFGFRPTPDPWPPSWE